MKKQDILLLLDEIDAFRRTHQDDPADWCMRAIEARIAEKAGYISRRDWTSALSANPETQYCRDIKILPF